VHNTEKDGMEAESIIKVVESGHRSLSFRGSTMLEVPTVQSVEKTFSVIRKSYITAFALLHFQV